MSNLYIESRLQAIKEIASKGCLDYKDADNISKFCDEIHSAISDSDDVCECLNIKNKVIDELKSKICMQFADWKLSEDDKWIKDIIELASESVEEISEQLKAGEK